MKKTNSLRKFISLFFVNRKFSKRQKKKSMHFDSFPYQMMCIHILQFEILPESLPCSGIFSNAVNA